MKTFRHIFFQVNPHQTHPLVWVPDIPLSILRVSQIGERHFAIEAERSVVLRDLVVLRHVRIKIILAIEFADRGYLALQDQAGERGELQGLQIHRRQGAGQSQADRTDMDIWLRTVLNGTTTKHLTSGLQLDMYFQPDRCDIITLHALRPIFLQSAAKSRKEEACRRVE
jgi:hypothetical protein